MFVNICMQCPVDVTESLVEPLRFWSRYAVIPLAGLSRRSLALMGMSCNKPYNFYLTTDFHNFCCKKISNQQAINKIKKINKMFNKTIWILTFFFLEIFF